MATRQSAMRVLAAVAARSPKVSEDGRPAKVSIESVRGAVAASATAARTVVRRAARARPTPRASATTEDDENLWQRVYDDAIAQGWPADIAKMLADSCDPTGCADAEEVLALCRAAGYPMSLAVDFVALRFKPAQARDAIRSAGINRQTLQMQMMSLRRSMK